MKWSPVDIVMVIFAATICALVIASVLGALISGEKMKQEG